MDNTDQSYLHFSSTKFIFYAKYLSLFVMKFYNKFIKKEMGACLPNQLSVLSKKYGEKVVLAYLYSLLSQKILKEEFHEIRITIEDRFNSRSVTSQSISEFDQILSFINSCEEEETTKILKDRPRIVELDNLKEGDRQILLDVGRSTYKRQMRIFPKEYRESMAHVFDVNTYSKNACP